MGFAVEEDDPKAEVTPFPRPAAAPQAPKIAIDALALAFKALSQRFIIALSNLFCLITAASVFMLFMSIHEPNVLQIVYCTIYAAFIVVLNWIVRTR